MATFRPHFKSTLLLNGAKLGPFSGRTFRDHEFDFFRSGARSAESQFARPEVTRNGRLWKTI